MFEIKSWPLSFHYPFLTPSWNPCRIKTQSTFRHDRQKKTVCVRVACEKDTRANARDLGVNRCVGAHGNLCRGSEMESVCVCVFEFTGTELSPPPDTGRLAAAREGANEERGENEQEEKKKGLRRENN